MFSLVAPYEPACDQPQAIAKLTDGLRSGAKHQVLLGGQDLHRGQRHRADEPAHAGAIARKDDGRRGGFPAVDAHSACCDGSVMPVETVYPHIVKAPGQPARLENHPRTRVAQIVMDYTEYGWSADEIQRQHPYLTLAEVYSALAYYFDHVEELDREIDEEWKESQRLAKTARPSPVLARLKALKRRNADAALS